MKSFHISLKHADTIFCPAAVPFVFKQYSKCLTGRVILCSFISSNRVTALSLTLPNLFKGNLNALLSLLLEETGDTLSFHYLGLGTQWVQCVTLHNHLFR